MTTADWTSARFPHRENDDGTFDSICPVCFRTVARAPRQEELAELERIHVCKLIRNAPDRPDWPPGDLTTPGI